MSRMASAKRFLVVASATSTVGTAKLLVVEDDDSIRETVEEALRAEGFDVKSCGNGADALALLAEPGTKDVDLLVLDLMLPGLGGLDLCRQLARSTSRAFVPLIVTPSS